VVLYLRVETETQVCVLCDEIKYTGYVTTRT